MKKIIPNQLDLFDVIEEETTTSPDYDQVLTDKASALLDLLNMDRKEKDKYEPQYTYQEGNYIVLIVANKEKDILFNILDVWGNIPPEFSVNWRTAQHIKQELKMVA